MSYDSQEISKVSQNLSLRLSPERKYAPRCVPCPSYYCSPLRCCSVCHYNVCRCCTLCHYFPCRCYLHCAPIRCCSPCHSPCRVLSPVKSSVRKPNSPTRIGSLSTNNATYNSPSRLRSQNNYNAYNIITKVFYKLDK